MSTNFTKNLRHICAESVSIAQVCRDIGIAPQQFNRYLQGKGMPSAHNLRRICHYFNLTEAELLSKTEEFIILRNRQLGNSSRNYKDPFANAFPGDLKRLRPHLGAYNVYFMSPSWSGQVMIAATFLDERDGQVYSRSVERGTALDQDQIQRARYFGKVGYHGSRIFSMEFESKQDGSITETILYPPHRQQRPYLRGITCGLAWRPRRMPFSTRVIWKKAKPSVTSRELLSGCGVFPLSSREIDTTVRNFLLEKTGFSGESV